MRQCTALVSRHKQNEASLLAGGFENGEGVAPSGLELLFGRIFEVADDVLIQCG